MSTSLVLPGELALVHGKPPTRIAISGYDYKLVSPYIPHPPLAQTVKLIWNWLSLAGRAAKNIMYAQFSGGAPTSDTTFLKTVANAVMTSLGGASLVNPLGNTWTLKSVTAKDNSGSSEAQADSDHAAIAGGDAGGTMPPQCAVTISWSIAASYRGGKPRTYLPGVTVSMLVNQYDSQLKATFASTLAGNANAFQTSFNASSPSGHDVILGTISYSSGHAARPTPVFRPFGLAHVHERLDSQRRRSGKESLFPST